MSIIERAADILTPAPTIEQKRSVPARAVADIDGAVERTAESIGPPRVTPTSAGREDGPAHAPSVASREQQRYAVDLEKLRRQRAITPDTERTPISENFRRIKRHILANVGHPSAPAGSNLVMVTSALPGEGKTYCTVNLAMSIAMEMDRTVLLVDADVAKPSLTTWLGMKPEPKRGLMDVLLNRQVEVADVLCRTDIGKLSILPAGTQHVRATEMLASEAMRALLQEMAERYSDRVIVFDSPPLLLASEASVLAGYMGQILVVVEAGKTTETVLRDALSRIEQRNIGVLLNKAEAPQEGYYGGYGYGYGYGHSE
jgi:protein-tyrosine kinase